MEYAGTEAAAPELRRKINKKINFVSNNERQQKRFKDAIIYH